MKWNDLFAKPTLGTTLDGVGIVLVIFLLLFVIELSMKVHDLKTNLASQKNSLEQQIVASERARFLSIEAGRLHLMIRRTREQILNSYSSGKAMQTAQYAELGPKLILYEDTGSFCFTTNRAQQSELVYMLDYYIDRTEQSIYEWPELRVPAFAELVLHQSYVVQLKPYKKFRFSLGQPLHANSELPLMVKYLIETGQKKDTWRDCVMLGTGPLVTSTKKDFRRQVGYARIIDVAMPDKNGVWFRHDFGRFLLDHSMPGEKHYLEISILCRDKRDDNGAALN